MVVRSRVPVRPALSELWPLDDERQSLERSLTIARVFVAALAGVSIFVESSGAGSGLLPVNLIAAGYFGFSLTALAILLWTSMNWTRGRAAVAVHAVDLACAVAVFMGDTATSRLIPAMYVVVA